MVNMNLHQLILAVLMAVAFSVAGTLPSDSLIGNNYSTINRTDGALLRRDDGNQGATFRPGPGRSYWPVDKASGLNVVKYCFQDATAQNAFGDKINAAWQMWQDALGGSASKKHGHNLSFLQYKDKDGNTPFCFDDVPKIIWNKAVPYETVVIRLDKEETSATPGYWLGPYGQEYVTEGNFNCITLEYQKLPSGDKTAPTFSIAHEMGHVFGMEHEQTRSDRDEHIHFECENVAQYDRVKSYIEQYDPNLDIWDVCFSAERKFVDYRTNIGFVPHFAQWARNNLKVDTSLDVGGYDVDSIMQYPSWSGAADSDRCKRERTHKVCPMMLWIEKDVSVKFIELPTKVTEKDVAGLRAKYPYNE